MNIMQDSLHGFMKNIMRGAKPLGKEGENMKRYFINIITGALYEDFITPAYPAYWKEISKKEYEERLLWKELEEDGLLPIQVNVLPECASFLGTDERHGTTFWRGVSGKMFELM